MSHSVLFPFGTKNGPYTMAPNKTLNSTHDVGVRDGLEECIQQLDIMLYCFEDSQHK